MSAYQRMIMSLSPACYLPLDETTGSTAADRSGNARNGTYNGSPSLGSRRILGKVACNFDGTDDYVSIPGTGLDPNTFTYFASVILDALPSGGAVVSEDYPGGSNVVDAIGFSSGAADGGVSGTTMYAGRYPNPAWVGRVFSTQPTAGVLFWVGYRNNAGTCQPFFNGVTSGATFAGGGSFAARTTNYLMKRWDGSGTNNYADGAMRDYVFYNAALTDAQMLALYNEFLRSGVSY